MEEYLLRYLFYCSERENIKKTDYIVLSGLCKKLMDEGFPKYTKITSSEVKKMIGVTRPSFTKSMKNLQLEGVVKYKSEEGRSGGHLVSVNFIYELIKSKELGDGSGSSIKKIVDRFIPGSENRLFPVIIPLKTGETNTDGNLQNDNSNSKESVQKDSISKKTTQNNDLNCKDVLKANLNENLQIHIEKCPDFLQNQTNMKQNYQNADGKWKITLQFFTEPNSFEINDLKRLIKQESRETKRFFASFSRIAFNKILNRSSRVYIYLYILLYNIINITLRSLTHASADTHTREGQHSSTNFQNELSHYIKTLKEKASPKKRNKKKDEKPFELNDETLHIIPSDLEQKKEFCYGREWNFEDSYSEWIYFRKTINKPVTNFIAKKELDYLKEMENPIYSIHTTIAKSYHGLNEFYPDGYQKKNKNFNTDKEKNEENQIVGRIIDPDDYDTEGNYIGEKRSK